MKLTKETKHLLRVGNILKLDDQDEYIVTNIQPDRCGNDLIVTIQHMETKQKSCFVPISSLYGAEVLYTMEGWQYRMKLLLEDIEKMDKVITDDHNRYIETSDEDEMEDFTISYRGQTISFPLDLAGFMNPVWELFEGIREEAEEQMG